MTTREIIRNFDKEALTKILNSSYSLAECLRRMGINHTQYTPDLNNRIKKDKIKYKLLIKNPQPNLKVNYFKNINTKEKAYWLGFLAADGYITKNKISLQLSSKDKKWLEKFVTDIGGEVSLIKDYLNKKTLSQSTRSCYTVYNKKFSKHLIQKGFLSPKAKNLHLPNFNNKSLDMAFLLGYFDGDGMEANTSMVSCNKQFLIQIKKKYKLKYEIKQPKKQSLLFSLTLGSPLFKEMLKDYPQSLPRKRKTYVPEIKINKVKKIIDLLSENDIINISELMPIKPVCFIAKKIGCSVKTLKKICKLHKINIPTKRRWSDEKDYLEKLRNRIKTPEYLAKLQKDKIQLRKYDYNKINILLFKGWKHSEIIKHLNIPKRRFYHILKRLKQVGAFP